MNSLFVHCKLYDADHDPTYPTLYNKCLLLDSTWSLNLIACFIWFAMILHIFQSPIISPFDDLESSFPNSNSQRRSTFHKFKDSLHSPLSSKTTTLTQTSYTDYKTKQLPPIIDRSSDATLCLPIHSKSYSTSESMDMKENMTDLLQPTEEKLEVPDHLFEQMKKNVKEDDDEEVNDDETTVVVNMEKDQSITTRRLKVTKSCPNIKKNILKMDKKKALDDMVLKY
ncbi:hypothetical protein BJ944DRAFT_52916 [Cunninghamella echinulata]|nr:hypothetical protein BJ944DRAFT_52916 [Cunninghamella echinulata]